MWANILTLLVAFAKPISRLVDWVVDLFTKSEAEVQRDNQGAKDDFDTTGRPK